MNNAYSDNVCYLSVGAFQTPPVNYCEPTPVTYAPYKILKKSPGQGQPVDTPTKRKETEPLAE